MVKKSQVTPSGIIKDAAKQLAEYYSERFSEHRDNLRQKAGQIKDKFSGISLPTKSSSKSHRNHRRNFSFGKLGIICAALFLPMAIVFFITSNSHQEIDDQQTSQSETKPAEKAKNHSTGTVGKESVHQSKDKDKKNSDSSNQNEDGNSSQIHASNSNSSRFYSNPIPAQSSQSSNSEPTQTISEPAQTEPETPTESPEPEITTTDIPTDTPTDQPSTEPEPTPTETPTDTPTSETTEEP